MNLPLPINNNIDLLSKYKNYKKEKFPINKKLISKPDEEITIKWTCRVNNRMYSHEDSITI